MIRPPLKLAFYVYLQVHCNTVFGEVYLLIGSNLEVAKIP